MNTNNSLSALLAVSLIIMILFFTACSAPFPAKNETNHSNDVIVQAQTGAPSIAENNSINSSSNTFNTISNTSISASPLEQPDVIPENLTNHSTIHYVSLIAGGFEVKDITIKVGETVAWKNDREGTLQKALVLGTEQCQPLRSKMFGPGEVYRWTFTQKQTCTVVDGIYTTKLMKVIVK